MAGDAKQQSLEEPSQRLLFLDVVRGLTVAFMILVNNNGSEESAYWPLKHSAWNGCTPTDLVFPTFLFLVGIAIVLSTASRISRGETKRSLVKHAFRRAVIIFVLSLVVHGFPSYPLLTMRVYGVLQRIAVCYLVVTLLYLWNQRAVVLISVAAGSLLTYWVLLRWVPIPGHGVPGRDFPFLDRYMNLDSIIDRKLFPTRLDEGVFDSEGLLSTIPALATCLFGVLTGLWLRTEERMITKARGLLVASIVGLALGSFWGIWFPINKRMWTSSYALYAAGWTLLALAVCYFLVEIRKHRGKWTYPWRVFGANAIFSYAFSELLASTLGHIHVADHGHPVALQQLIYAQLFSSFFSPSFGSLVYSLCFVLICFLPALALYRRRIFIKF